MNQYRVIDNLEEYVQKQKESGARTILAEKAARILARKGVAGERVITWSVDQNGEPLMEKEGEVLIDSETGMTDWVVTKTDKDGNVWIDANGNKNQWIIKDSAFREKYEEDPNQEGLYRAASGIQKFICLEEGIHIVQWGEEWNVDKGGYINITKKEDMYVISSRDFKDTYRIL